MPIVYDDQQQQPTKPGIVYDDAPPAAPDKYQAAAVAERDKLLKAGVPLSEGYTRRLGMGASMGWLDEGLAGASVPFEMIRQGTLNPAEAYRYTIARERLANEKTRENTAGVLGMGSELLGGVGGFGAAAAGAGPALSALRVPFTSKMLPQWAATTGKNAAIGSVLGTGAGAGEAEVAGANGSWSNLPSHMLSGAAVGGTVGAVAPPLIQGAGKVLGATSRVAQMPRMFAPQTVADARVGEIARAGNVAPEEIVQRIGDAAASGQPYTVADAIGNEGARALAGMGKTPGAQREAITEALTTRKMQMPQRVGDQVQQALGAPGTAQQATEALIDRAGAQSAPKYREAEAYPTWSNRLQEFLDDPIARQGLRHGVEIQRIDAAGSGRPFNPRDAMITDFDAAGDPIITGVPNMRTLNTMKVGLDKMIENSFNPATGRLDARGRALVGFKNRMLGEMDAINPAYGEARGLYSEPMRIKDAVKTGQDMVSRGRPGDTVRVINDPALAEPERQGLRIGYADKLLEPLERTGNLPTALRAKSPKGTAELDALSLYQGPRRPGEPDQFRKFMDREEAMQRHEGKALGGPATAENLADMAAADASAGAMGAMHDVATGNKLGLVMRGFNWLGKQAQGNSDAQRMAITRALLETDPTAAQAMAARIAKREAAARALQQRDVTLRGGLNVP